VQKHVQVWALAKRAMTSRRRKAPLVIQGASDVSARKGFEDHVSDLVLEIWNATTFPWCEGLWHLSAASGRRHPKHLHEADRAGESDMPYETTDDGVRLATGSGHPLIPVHEFAGDLRSFEPQMRIFGKRYRAIAFNARGFSPSDVPEHVSSYSQVRAAAIAASGESSALPAVNGSLPSSGRSVPFPIARPNRMGA